MEINEYEFDLAISLLAQDEPFAFDLRQRLMPKVNRIFLYSTSQKDLQLKDMMDEFTAVFQRKARVVLVLYRKKWGSTRWTTIEQEIIKARQLDQAASDYLMMIRMDKSEPRGPKWYSDVHHRVDAEDYTPNQLAAIIENELRRRGAQVRLESLEEMADRIRSEWDRLNEFKALYKSSEGARLALEEVRRMNKEIKDRYEDIATRLKTDSGIIEPESGNAMIKVGKVWLISSWENAHTNSLTRTRLFVELSNGMRLSDSPFDRKRHMSYWVMKFHFAMDHGGTYGWSPEGQPDAFYRSEDLVELALRKVIEKNHDEYKNEHLLEVRT